MIRETEQAVSSAPAAAAARDNATVQPAATGDSAWCRAKVTSQIDPATTNTERSMAISPWFGPMFLI